MAHLLVIEEIRRQISSAISSVAAAQIFSTKSTPGRFYTGKNICMIERTNLGHLARKKFSKSFATVWFARQLKKVLVVVDKLCERFIYSESVA